MGSKLIYGQTRGACLIGLVLLSHRPFQHPNQTMQIAPPHRPIQGCQARKSGSQGAKRISQYCNLLVGARFEVGAGLEFLKRRGDLKSLLNADHACAARVLDNNLQPG